MLLEKFFTFYRIHCGNSLIHNCVPAIVFHLNYCNHEFTNLVDS